MRKTINNVRAEGRFQGGMIERSEYANRKVSVLRESELNQKNL